MNIGFEEAMKLWHLPLHELGKKSNSIREKAHRKKTYFNINRHINPTNVCKDSCKFCAYSANRKNDRRWTMSVQEIVKTAAKCYEKGTKEVHIVSAHNAKVDVAYYFETFREIKKACPDIHIKALTAAEVHFLSKRMKKSYAEVLEMVEKSGVDSMPGGGAEIFDPQIRQEICAGKVNSEQWLQIHKIWHEMGHKSNATMLFGHIENRVHRIDHLLRLRDLQEQTRGFNCFIPLVYQTKNNYLGDIKPATGVEILKTIAISRIVLDNFLNIKAYWATLGINLALVMQEYGANDLDGTIEKESIQSAGGASSQNGMEVEDLVGLIRNSGFKPVERDSLYNELKYY